MLSGGHCSTAEHGTLVLQGTAQLRLQASAMLSQDPHVHKAGRCMSSQKQGEAADDINISVLEEQHASPMAFSCLSSAW